MTVPLDAPVVAGRSVETRLRRSLLPHHQTGRTVTDAGTLTLSLCGALAAK